MDKDPWDRDPPQTETPGMETPWDADPLPPVNRITDMCKNITLPQLRHGR